MWSIDENESCKHLTEKLETEWHELAEKYVKLTIVRIILFIYTFNKFKHHHVWCKLTSKELKD